MFSWFHVPGSSFVRSGHFYHALGPVQNNWQKTGFKSSDNLKIPSNSCTFLWLLLVLIKKSGDVSGFRIQVQIVLLMHRKSCRIFFLPRCFCNLCEKGYPDKEIERDNHNLKNLQEIVECKFYIISDVLFGIDQAHHMLECNLRCVHVF